MKILNMIAADEEISQLKKELKEKTGQSLGSVSYTHLTLPTT